MSASEKEKAGRKEADDIDDVDTHREDAIAASLSKRAAKVKMGQELLAALVVVVFAAILYRRWRSQQQFSTQPRELALPTFDSFAFDEGDQTGSESFDKADDASDSFAEGFELPEMSAVDIDGLAEEEAGFGAAGARRCLRHWTSCPFTHSTHGENEARSDKVRHKGAKTHEPLPAEDDSEDFCSHLILYTIIIHNLLFHFLFHFYDPLHVNSELFCNPQSKSSTSTAEIVIASPETKLKIIATVTTIPQAVDVRPKSCAALHIPACPLRPRA